MSRFPDMTSAATLDNSSFTIGEHAHEMTFIARTLLYAVTPNESSFATVEEVPNYFLKSLHYGPWFFMPEVLLLFLQGKPIPRFTDSMCSFCCALLIFLPVAVLGQLEMGLYVWMYENFHIVDLPWQSPVTWVLCMLGTDLGLYLWHRAAHEINIIWAFHQVHHTSQEFNLTVGLRLPAFNRYVAILFYLPCALFFPPSVFYVHYQLNYMFQLWIHTATLPSLGVLDYFINNPSLHRVHHGRNRYCIDKNYGAVFSFWDIVFGTFEREKKGEEIYYGLVHSVNSFDPLYIQVHHLKYMCKKFGEYTSIGNKLSTFLKGPGWEPDKPRLGFVTDIPEVPEDKTLYERETGLLMKLYLMVHFLIALFLFNKIKLTKLILSDSMVWIQAGYIFWSVACIGYLMEQKRVAPLLESARCVFYFVLEVLLQSVLPANLYVVYTLRVVFLLSLLFWSTNRNMFTHTDSKTAKKKKVPTATLR